MKVFFLSIAFALTASTAHAEGILFCVQVSRCVHMESAEHVYERLSGYDTVRIEKGNGAYIVSVGSYRTHEKAESLLVQLKKGYPDAFIRKLAIGNMQVVRGYSSARPREKKVSKTISPAVGKVAKPGVTPPSVIGPPVKTRGLAVNPPETGTSVTVPTPHGTPPAKPLAKNDNRVALAGHDAAKKKNAPTHSVDNSISATEKKPDLSKAAVLNEKDCYRLGMQNYRGFKFNEAIDYLSRYISLSPDGSQCPSALFIMGKSCDAMGRHLAALGIFSRVLEKYPQSPEAVFSILAMASIGSARPALHYPIFMPGSEYFMNPILAYDTVLAKPIPTSMVEDILFQKSRIFFRQGRHKETYDICANILKEFPTTSNRKEVLDTLRASSAILIDGYQKSGDHLATVELYFKSKGRGYIDSGDRDTILKSAISLAYVGFYDDSLGLIQSLRGNPQGVAISDLDKMTAEVERIRTANAASGKLPPDVNWGLFQSGREYANSNDQALAEQTLTKLKNTGGEGFWSKVSDYALEDRNWNQKYRGYLGGKH